MASSLADVRGVSIHQRWRPFSKTSSTPKPLLDSKRVRKPLVSYAASNGWIGWVFNVRSVRAPAPAIVGVENWRSRAVGASSPKLARLTTTRLTKPDRVKGLGGCWERRDKPA